jgi:DNA-binding transcriptional MerR regulator
VERLAFITAAKRLGLPLEEIAELLHVSPDTPAPRYATACAPVWLRGFASVEPERAAGNS